MQHCFSLTCVHPSWQPLLQQALAAIAPSYLQTLNQCDWLPGAEKIFNAFTLPLPQVNYILFGESPYPRPRSANGFAFWDDAVTDLWSEQGLAKAVNRATSLRNIIKMLLVAAKKLSPQDCSQTAIAKLDKHDLVQTIAELFGNMQKHGILLLNATLVLRPSLVATDTKAWQPFVNTLLHLLYQQRQQVELILLGKMASQINELTAAQPFKKFVAEHPYNISFITNLNVLEFFAPLQLLQKSSK